MQIKLKKGNNFSTCTSSELIQLLLIIKYKLGRYKQYCFGNFFYYKNAFQVATFSFAVLRKQL